MDERYRQIYASIYVDRTGEGPRLGRGFPRGPGYGAQYGRDVATGVRDAIEAAEGETGVRLREDAKALLAVNFQDLVVYPLAVGGVAGNEVLADVASDIRLL